jgi:hypothetical protein
MQIFIPTGHGYFDLGATAGTLHIEANWNGGGYQTIASVVSLPSALVLTYPKDYHGYQRTTRTSGFIYVAGTLNGVSWSGLLPGVPGQGSITVRVVESPGISATKTPVALSDLFAFAGQSNNGGRFTNGGVASSTDGFTAVQYFNNNVWYIHSDPYDEGNSWVPDFATIWQNRHHVPVSIMSGPSHGGSSWADWQPGADHLDTATFYGLLNSRIAALGSRPLACNWWLGETDALAQTNLVTLRTQIENVVDSLYVDTGGVRSVLCLLQNSTGIPDADEANFRNLIRLICSTNSHAILGPDLSDIDSDDSFHPQTDAKRLLVAQRWAQRLDEVFYPSPTVPMAPASIGMPSNASSYDLVMV